MIVYYPRRLATEPNKLDYEKPTPESGIWTLIISYALASVASFFGTIKVLAYALGGYAPDSGATCLLLTSVIANFTLLLIVAKLVSAFKQSLSARMQIWIGSIWGLASAPSGVAFMFVWFG